MLWEIQLIQKSLDQCLINFWQFNPRREVLRLNSSSLDPFLTDELLFLPNVCEKKKVHCILGFEKIFNESSFTFHRLIR